MVDLSDCSLSIATVLALSMLSTAVHCAAFKSLSSTLTQSGGQLFVANGSFRLSRNALQLQLLLLLGRLERLALCCFHFMAYTMYKQQII